jgi:hypothetical protein
MQNVKCSQSDQMADTSDKKGAKKAKGQSQARFKIGKVSGKLGRNQRENFLLLLGFDGTMRI